MANNFFSAGFGFSFFKSISVYFQGFLMQCNNFYQTIYFTQITWRGLIIDWYKKARKLISLEFALPSNSVTIAEKLSKMHIKNILPPQI